MKTMADGTARNLRNQRVRVVDQRGLKGDVALDLGAQEVGANLQRFALEQHHRCMRRIHGTDGRRHADDPLSANHCNFNDSPSSVIVCIETNPGKPGISAETRLLDDTGLSFSIPIEQRTKPGLTGALRIEARNWT